MIYLAIDPGPIESAYVVIDSDRRPLEHGKYANAHLLHILQMLVPDKAAIEWIASYGMAVGAEVFETCMWVGRFVERAPYPFRRVFRRDVKLHHCGSARAKDANVTRALVDRFAYGQPNYGKGSKAQPGFFHGFRADIWQAMACAVYLADISETREGAA